MKEKVVKKLETNVAELLMILLVVIVLMSSCGSSRCASAPNSWGSNCAAYR